MRFADPGVLLFLVAPLLAAVALIGGVWYRRHRLARMGQRVTVEQQLARPSPYLRALKGIALVLGLAALVLAAARPQYGGRIQMLKKRGIDVVVALDFSKSMLAADVRPNRLERAKLELAEFIGRLTGDRVGLVAFAGDTIRFPLTSDYAAATAFWRGLGPYDMPVGGTAIGKALVAATRMLEPKAERDEQGTADLERSKVIVLITDGEDHLGDPVAAAEAAAEKGIIIHVLGVGSDSPELIPRHLDDGTVMGYQKTENGDYVTTALSAENEEQLRQLASVSGGRYFRAGNDLSGMASIVAEIRKMKQTEVEARQITVYEEVFQWFLLPALAVLLAAFLVPDRRFSFSGRRA
ncbi:MAG: VWA domain-containing protein [Deltaproteobacteria bacterium]|jgi:Ca-activated chloride channel family protein|nr:VWA domain-containing protein [Deltaproteobacteria bacterium]